VTNELAIDLIVIQEDERGALEKSIPFKAKTAMDSLKTKPTIVVLNHFLGPKYGTLGITYLEYICNTFTLN